MPPLLGPPVLSLQVPPLPPASLPLLFPSFSVTFMLAAHPERKPQMEFVRLEMSFLYVKGSHCSIIQ